MASSIYCELVRRGAIYQSAMAHEPRFTIDMSDGENVVCGDRYLKHLRKNAKML